MIRVLNCVKIGNFNNEKEMKTIISLTLNLVSMPTNIEQETI
jgi:hypothetical protein